jgi:hypothetical protein
MSRIALDELREQMLASILRNQKLLIYNFCGGQSVFIFAVSAPLCHRIVEICTSEEEARKAMHEYCSKHLPEDRYLAEEWPSEVPASISHKVVRDLTVDTNEFSNSIGYLSISTFTLASATDEMFQDLAKQIIRNFNTQMPWEGESDDEQTEKTPESGSPA